MRPNYQNKADEILAIYRFYRCDSRLYLSDDTAKIDDLFEAVVYAIDDAGPLKPMLPYNEFILPSRKVLDHEPSWVGHFEDRDNRRFFLSDVFDFLNLFCRYRGR